MFRGIQRHVLRYSKHTSIAPQRGILTGVEFLETHPAPRRPLNVLFFGSSDVAVPTLIELNKARVAEFGDNTYPLIGKLEVVVPPPKTRGKKLALTVSDVETAAMGLNLPIHRLAAGTSFRMSGFELPDGPFDIGVVISFGYMIRPDVISSFPMGMINAHASLLPALRGAAPIQYALIRGLRETGITVTTLHPTVIDAGRVLYAAPIPIPPRATFASLAPVIATQASSCILHVLHHWNEAARNSVEQSQLPSAESIPPELRTAPKIKKTDGVINWATMTSQEVAARWCGLTGFTPLFCMFAGKRVELLDIEDEEHELLAASAQSPVENASLSVHTTADEPPLRAGDFYYDAARAALVVQCREGRVLVRRLQLECKKPATAKEFANGHLLKKGILRETFF